MANGKSGYGFKLLTTETTPVCTISSLSLKQNTNYTVSFIAWCDSGTQSISNDLFPDDLPETSFTITTTATKYSWVLNSASSDMGSCILRFFKAGTIATNVYITDIKLESGNRSTDWTAAPEDVDAAITSVQTVTNTNTTSITAIQGQISTLISNTTITTGGTQHNLKMLITVQLTL